MEDYSKLEGKEVKFITSYGETEILIVAGCDKDVGLTMYKKGNKEDNRICLTGPLSPVKPAGKTHGDEKEGLGVYDAMFNAVVDGIVGGKIISEDVLAAKQKASNSMEFYSGKEVMDCAFSQ